MEKKVSGNKMHRVWTFIVSLVITAAAITAIVVLAIVSKKPVNEDNAVNGIIDNQAENSLIHGSNTTDNSSSNYSDNSSSDLSTDNSSSISSSSSSSSASNSSSNPIPNTGPEDIIGLALLCGSIAMYVASQVMVKRDNLAINR